MAAAKQTRLSGHTIDHRKNQIAFVAIEVGAREVIEFAAVIVDKFGFYELESFSTLIKAAHGVSAESIAVNGISEKMLHDAPAFEAVAHTIHTLLDGRVVAGYGVSHDLPVLKKAFEALRHAPPTESGLLDTAPLLKDHFGGRVQETKLDSLGHYFGLGGKRNRAAEDCRLAIATLKGAALGLFLERSVPHVFHAPTYASATVVAARSKAPPAPSPSHAAAAAELKKDEKSDTPPPAAEAVATEQPPRPDSPKRKKAKGVEQSPMSSPAPAPVPVQAVIEQPKPNKAGAAAAAAQFAAAPFTFVPAAQPVQAAPQPAVVQKVKPSPIQRPSPHVGSAVPPLQPQQQSAIFSQLSQPVAGPGAAAAAAATAAAAPSKSPRTAPWAAAQVAPQGKPANLLLSPTAATPIATSAPSPAANGKAAVPAMGTSAAVAAVSKMKWSQITEAAEKTPKAAPAGATTPGGTSLAAAAATPTAATPTPKAAGTPSAAAAAAKKPAPSPAAANGDDGWQQPKSKPKKSPSNAAANGAASPAAAAGDDVDVDAAAGWTPAESRKQKRANAAAAREPVPMKDAAGKARDKAWAKASKAPGSSRPPLDETCVAALEDAIAKKKKVWVMYFNPAHGNRALQIAPVGWEKRPALLKAFVEGETEVAYFTTRKIVEIRDENTFEAPLSPDSL